MYFPTCGSAPPAVRAPLATDPSESAGNAARLTGGVQ